MYACVCTIYVYICCISVCMCRCICNILNMLTYIYIHTCVCVWHSCLHTHNRDEYWSVNQDQLGRGGQRRHRSRRVEGRYSPARSAPGNTMEHCLRRYSTL